MPFTVTTIDVNEKNVSELVDYRTEQTKRTDSLVLEICSLSLLYGRNLSSGARSAIYASQVKLISALIFEPIDFVNECRLMLRSQIIYFPNKLRLTLKLQDYD